MAFLNRVGNALKQTVSKHAASQFPAPNATLFQAIRSMSSSTKLFVGGLSYAMDEMSLREAFSQYGEVVEARVILDRDSGRSRGFGFVTFTSTEAASSAIQAFDGQDLHGRRVRVNYATEKPRGGGFGGGYGAGGGGFGGGYGAGGGYNYGGQGGNYGRGGYQGGNYQGGGGGGGYGISNQYPSGGGGFGGADNYPSQTGAGYSGDGNYSSGASNYAGGQAGFDSLSNNETTGTIGGNQEQLSGHPESDAEAVNEDLERDSLDENTRDENDEPNDYANTRS